MSAKKPGFVTFTQNNSGGRFDFDEDRGITHHVIIEANTADQASARAHDVGLYFDGVSSGMDCGCCGDRWYEPWSADMDAEPTVYGKPASSATGYSIWMPEGKEICIHYLDGRKQWFGVTKEKS